MISTLFNYFFGKEFTPTTFQNENEIDLLIQQISQSTLKDHKLTCHQNQDKTYTLQARQIKWYEPITSIFWVNEKDDAGKVNTLLDDIIRNNRKRFIDTKLSQKAIDTIANIPGHDGSIAILRYRIRLVNKLEQKIPQYKVPEAPKAKINPPPPAPTKVDFSNAETQAGPLLTLPADLIRTILSFTGLKGVGRFMRTSKKSLIVGKKAISPLLVLQNCIKNKKELNLEDLYVDSAFTLSEKDRNWIRGHSTLIVEMLSKFDNISSDEKCFNFFKAILANCVSRDLGKLEDSTKDENLKQFVNSFLKVQQKVIHFYLNQAPLKDLIDLNWNEIGPLIKSCKEFDPLRERFCEALIDEKIEMDADEVWNKREFFLFILFMHRGSTLENSEKKFIIDKIPLKLLQDVDFAKRVVELDGEYLKHLPEKIQKHPDVILSLLAHGSSYFIDIDPKLKTDPNFILKAVKINGMILGHLEFQEKTVEVEKAAVSQDGRAYQYAIHKTKELALLAVKQNGQIFNGIKREFGKDFDIVKEAIKTYPLALLDADESLWGNLELNELAVEEADYFDLIKLQSTLFRPNNKNLMIKAIRKGFISNRLDLDDPDILREYLKKNPRIIESDYFLRERILKNEKLLRVLIELDPTKLEMTFNTSVRNDLELFKKIIKTDWRAYIYLGDELIDNDELFKLAFDQNPEALLHARSPRHLTPQNWAIAVSRGLTIAQANYKIRNNKDIVHEVVKIKGNEIKYASSELQDDEEVVKAAIEQDWRALQFASTRLKNDEEIVILAALQNENALKFAGDEIKNNPFFMKLFNELKEKRQGVIS